MSALPFVLLAAMGVPSPTGAAGAGPDAPPNVILCMADDLGWGDTGYNGHPVLRTPHLDALARSGVRFERFYAAAPVCSPTRGSCLTGRHPYRYGITFANTGHLPPEEVTLAEVLRAKGYATGHFGKWHLGTLTTSVRDSNRGRPGATRHYSPPWANGFDVCFSTEAKVPTWDPMKDPRTGGPYGTRYWTEDGKAAGAGLEGDDSRVIMDRVLPFVRDAASGGKPFLAVIWFHTPHRPVVAGGKYLAMYDGHEHAAYYGSITAMDDQVGRLRRELEKLGVWENTMLWFASDNGPEGRAGRAPGSAGPLRGRKRSLFEGGVRVPAFLVWPAKVREPRVVTAPCSTSDYLPTVLDALGVGKGPHGDAGTPRPLDGESILPLVEGRAKSRARPIAFASGKQLALTGDRWKLITRDAGTTWMLFDLEADAGESRDLSRENLDTLREMRVALEMWRSSLR